VQIEVRKENGVITIEVAGTMTMLDRPRQLTEQVAEAVRSGERRLVLNLGGLTMIDSSCIGELVACSLSAARAGATLKIAEPTRRIIELLLVTRLSDVFECYETEASAIASFHGVSGSPGRGH
jgi:anti-sigma B factor antagonist